MTEDRALLLRMVMISGQVVSLGDNSKGMTEGQGYSIARNVVSNKTRLLHLESKSIDCVASQKLLIQTI